MHKTCFARCESCYDASEKLFIMAAMLEYRYSDIHEAWDACTNQWLCNLGLASVRVTRQQTATTTTTTTTSNNVAPIFLYHLQPNNAVTTHCIALNH